MSYICRVKQGNLLDIRDATFIVNASNTMLQLGSGVSAAFKKKCGIKLQQEMLDKLTSLDQALQKGDVIATSSGNASNFKYALHAAVMDYNQGIKGDDKLPSLADIKTILINIELYLKWYADNNENETIKLVLPLMGCGVGKLNKVEVLECYKKFFQRDISFNCQVMVDGYSDEDYRLAKSICTQINQAHNSWSKYYDFVNEQSFGSFVENLTFKTLKVINDILPNHNATIVDFGAGSGRLSVPLAKQGYGVSAVEPSRGMIQVLKEKIEVKKLCIATYQTTLQKYNPSKQADLGAVVFTVLSYITTEEDLDMAIKVMALSIKEGGYILMDIPSKSLFSSSHIVTEYMDRDIQINLINNHQYEYVEICSGKVDEENFFYQDTFIIRYWEAEHILEKMKKAKLILKEDLSDNFSSSSAGYYLFQKEG